MNQLFKISLLLIITSSCKKNESTDTIVSNTISVKASSTYTVLVEPNITYGQGLSHQTINSTSFTTMDLKLDVYKPANNTKKNLPYY